MKHCPVIIGMVALLFCTATTRAQTYYVSSTAGNDANDGRTPASALRSVAKANTLALQPGDSVLFMRGDSFAGELTAKPGSVGRPVVYGAYGSGNRPLIDGSVRIPSSGWAVHRGAIVVKSDVTMPALTEAEPAMLFFNGRTMLPARYPNRGFLQAQNVRGGNPGSHCCEFSFAFTDTALGGVFPSQTDLTGALVTAYDPYGVSTRQIRAYDPGSGDVSIDTLRGAAFIGHRLYFLSAALPLLDQEGEWCYDAAARKLYAWFPGGVTPGISDTIACSGATHGINAWQVDDIVVRDLEIRRQKISGLFLVRSDRVTVENCRFGQMKNGIILWGTTGPPEIRNREVRIVYNEFTDIFRTAINARNLEECTISGNDFRDIAVVNALGQSGRADQWGGYGYYEYGVGIQASGINSLVLYNRFFNTGRQALAVGGQGVAVRYNVVDSSCLNYNDCGGIMPLGWSRVEHNIVRNSTGPIEQYRSTGARGIYPDFRVEDTIRHNTIVNTRVGIGLTNSKNEIVEGNTIYGSLESQFRMNKKNAGVLDNRIVGNVFFGLDAAQHSVNWDNQIMEPDAGILDSNRYWNPYVGFPTVKFKKDSLSGEAWYDLAAWKTTGHDMHSTQEFLSYASPYVVRDTVGNNLVSNGSFESGAAGWSYPDSMTVVSGVLDGNCLRLKKNSGGSKTLVTILTKQLDSTRTYLVRFTIADPSNIGRVNLRLRENGGTYAASVDRWYLTKSSRREYYTVFKPVVSAATRLEFVSSNSTWWIDNIALFEVDAQYVDPSDAFPIFVNDSDQPRSFALGERCYLDLDSSFVTQSVTVPPWSSKILIALDSCSATNTADPPTSAELQFDIYPNPCSGTLTVISDATTPVDLWITDVLGRIVDRRGVWEQGAVTINLSGLAPGMYLVRLCTADGISRIRRLLVRR
ncbi:MAG: right-handed parallel beta-helix repeat-containing protein [Bacteroidetes bacterium]|nr:right-handed parallel beta-helix repeat-containing protein [Bacteroidota bacterium]